MKKWTVVGLYWGIQVITDIIRVSLGVLTLTLMTLYQISPKEMGYVLSGWNWAYTWLIPGGVEGYYLPTQESQDGQCPG